MHGTASTSASPWCPAPTTRPMAWTNQVWRDACAHWSLCNARLQRIHHHPEATMNILKPLLASLLLAAATTTAMAQHAAPATPPHAIVKTLMTKPLAQHPGEELVMISVEYPPGSVDPVHRHNANALVYVVDGSIVMGLRGSKPVTLGAGQTFYEGPNDVHEVGRNASNTRPAKFIVVLLKKTGAPILVPVK